MSWLTRFAPLASRGLDGVNLQAQVEAWTDRDQLEGLIFQDITGVAPTWFGREAAMRVPAVARARHLNAGTIAKLPLYAFRAAERVEPQPYWMHGTDGQTGNLTPGQVRRYGLSYDSPHWRMLWTVDDLMFHGLSLWLATARSAPDERTGRTFPLRMARVPFGLWQLDGEHGRVVDQDGQPFPPESVILIPGPHEGLLSFAQDTIRQAAALERTASDVARHPFRLELHQTTDSELSPAERRKLIAEARAALADSAGILFTNSAVETKTHKLDAAELLIAGRNAAALDIARHASMPGAMLDATTEGASLEYQTTTSRNQQWLDYGLSLYMDPISARLGMDDVLPAGQRCAFDTTGLTTAVPDPTGPATED